ncbi:MAG: hypothetical protein ABIQ39_11920, partial [Ilumatobacteraceae bacterium]
MQHEDSEDDYGFWEAEPTRTLRRVRPHHDEPTRQLRAVAAGRRSALSGTVHPGSRAHGLTGQVPVVAVVSARRSDAEDLPVSRRGPSAWLQRFRRPDNSRPDNGRPQNGRVDPLVARIAAILVIAAVGIPFAVAAGGSSSANVRAAVGAGATTGQATPASPAAIASTMGQPSGSVGIASSVATPGTPSTPGPQPSPIEAASDSGAAAAPAGSAVTADAPPKGSSSNGQVIEQVAPTCAKTYVVGAGDYWIGLADSA